MTVRTVPTARALALLVLLASLAVLIAALAPGAWPVAPLAGLGLLAAIWIDGVRAGGISGIELQIAPDAEVGQMLKMTVSAGISPFRPSLPPQAALSFDTRLGTGGTAEIVLSPAAEPGRWHGQAVVVPQRRGTAVVDGLWLRWPGPWRLGTRQVRQDPARTIRIWPDISPARSPALQHYLQAATFGQIARRFSGEGTQFEALAEFHPGMDRRRMDWKASARHMRLYARENEAERDNQIVFAVDCGQSMAEELDGLPRLDRAITAALTAAYVALKGGDRVAIYGFADRPQVLTPFASGTAAFHRLQSAAAGLDYSAREANFTFALASLATKVTRRSLIVLFSDFADPTGAEIMIESVERLVRHHLVIFVTMQDAELEALAMAQPMVAADVASAVAADALAQQRDLVLERLRRLGVDVIEAPWQAIGYRLIDRYLAMRGREMIG